MNPYEAYWLLIVDTWISNLIFSLYDSTISSAMAYFNYNAWLINICTVLSILSAMLCNYLLGRIIYNIYNSIKASEPVNYNKIYNFAIKYCFIVIIISFFLGLLKFIILALGFLRIPIIKIFSITSIILALYYLYIVIF